MPELSDLDALNAGQYVRCSRHGRWVGPSDPAWLPDEESGEESGFCVTELDFGAGVPYPCPSED